MSSELTSEISSTDRWLARLPRRWHLGVIVGGTGTGKTRALHELRDAGFISNILSASASAADWPAELAVVSVIANSELVAKAARKSTDDFFKTEPTAEERAAHAIVRLSASGLNSLGPWRLPYRALSNGQQARADVARVVSSHLALDDFGATVEALSACSCATGVARLVRRLQLESAAQHAQELLSGSGL